jgi:hypothetical protein
MRRRKTSALKPKNVITSIVVCSAVCLAGIGYIWAKTQVWAVSREIKTLEIQLEDLRRQNERLQRKYAAMCTAGNLEARVKELNLGLVSPQPDQIVRLVEPTPIARQKGMIRTYAANTNE